MKTEKGKTKGKTKRTSGRELVLRGKVGVLKQEEFLCTAPLQAGSKGSCEVFENWAKQEIRGQKTEKVTLLSP